MTTEITEYKPGSPMVKEDTQPMLFDPAKFDHAWKVSTMLADADLVPDHFRKKPCNVMIALNLADRMRMDPFMLMQEMYVVHGKPGISGKMAIALINTSGRFSPLRFKFDGEGKGRSCTAYAKDLDTGEELSQTVSWSMVEAEGWDKDKKSTKSKWTTMPDIMFQYRSAIFFARMYCPGTLMGLRTDDELEDIGKPVELMSPKEMIIEAEAQDTTPDPLKFEERVKKSDIANHKHLADYIEFLAKMNNREINALMEEAGKNKRAFDRFVADFKAWVKDKEPNADSQEGLSGLRQKIDELEKIFDIAPEIARKAMTFKGIEFPDQLKDIAMGDEILKKFDELIATSDAN